MYNVQRDTHNLNANQAKRKAADGEGDDDAQPQIIRMTSKEAKSSSSSHHGFSPLPTRGDHDATVHHQDAGQQQQPDLLADQTDQ